MSLEKPKADMEVTISKIHAVLFSGPAETLSIPGSEGEMTILPHHAPLITTLKKGILRVKSARGTEEFPIDGGIAEIGNNRATVLL